MAASKPVNGSVCQELGSCVTALTHSGQRTLDAANLKRVKSICRLSDAYVEHTYHLVLHQMQEQHSEVRYSAFQICDELFRRSHCFRELLVSNLQQVMELTVELTGECRLPPPRTAAKNLKCLALTTINDWNRHYGDAYKRLRLGYNFLKHTKKVDFSALEMQNSIERMQQQERERRQTAINEQRLQKVLAEMDELLPEIANTLTEMENCISLLVPVPEDFFIAQDATNEVGDSQEIFHTSKHPASGSSKEPSSLDIRAHGVVTSNFSIEVNLKPDEAIVTPTAENAVIFENAQDLHTLLTNRSLPHLRRLEQALTKISNEHCHLQKIVDMKCRVEKVLEKYNKLGNICKTNRESESEDSDFEEVSEKEGYEDVAASENFIAEASMTATTGNHQAGPKTDWNIWSGDNDEKDPTTAQSTLATLAANKTKTPSISGKNVCNEQEEEEQEEQQVTRENTLDDPQPSTSKQSDVDGRKCKLLAVAPKLPYDIDLYHWEDEKITAPTMLMVKPEGGRFWSATSTADLEDVPVPDGPACLRTRVIEFSGQYEPVKWSCRAPLPNGKLCPRRDRYKCPFHGPIVPRDEMGQCTRAEDAMRLASQAEQKQQKCPDWQNPVLLAEIKEATGIDLQIPVKGTKRKKKKLEEHPGLTNIKDKQNSAFNRLSRKVFKRSAMKKVAEVLDRADHKRHRDKYGDQFHYMHGTV